MAEKERNWIHGNVILNVAFAIVASTAAIGAGEYQRQQRAPVLHTETPAKAVVSAENPSATKPLSLETIAVCSPPTPPARSPAPPSAHP